MKLVRLCAALLTASVLIPTVAAAPKDRQPISVCQLFAGARKYNGKVVSVRGVFFRGPVSSVLADRTPCLRPLFRHGYEWPNSIWVEWVAENLLEGAGLKHELFKALASHSDELGHEVTLSGKIAFLKKMD